MAEYWANTCQFEQSISIDKLRTQKGEVIRADWAKHNFSGAGYNNGDMVILFDGRCRGKQLLLFNDKITINKIFSEYQVQEPKDLVGRTIKGLRHYDEFVGISI